MMTTIVPKYIDEPKPGKRNWSVKGEDGTGFSVPPDLASLFVKGQPIAVEYEERSYNGKNFNMVSSARAGGSPAPRANGHAGGGHVKDDRMIFITGVVGRAMGSGKFGANEIKLLTLAAKEAWEIVTDNDPNAPI